MDYVINNINNKFKSRILHKFTADDHRSPQPSSFRPSQTFYKKCLSNSQKKSFVEMSMASTQRLVGAPKASSKGFEGTSLNRVKISSKESSPITI